MYRPWSPPAVLGIYLLPLVRSGDNPYIDDEDTRVANMADEAADLYCTGGFKGDADRDAGREDLLKGAGNDNIILSILKEANSTGDVTDVAEKKLTLEWLVWKVTPVLSSLCMVIVWSMCCWTACPGRKCCRCCRCCAAERSTPKAVKIAAVALLALLMAGIFICAGLAMGGYRRSRDGFENMACTSAKLINVTLAGEASPPFIGMMPTLDRFWELEQLLDNNSAFLNQTMDLLGGTRKISQAVTVASGTMTILREMMSNPANTRPQGSSGDGLLHTCDLCTEIVPSLDTAIAELDNGVGVALANARTEVDKQLTWEKRSDLRADLRESTKPLIEVMGVFRGPFSFFVEADRFERVKKHIDGDASTMLLACLLIVFFAVMLTACGCASLMAFLCCEKSKDAQARGEAPYTKAVHRCACCAWCCSFLYVLLVFLIGGIMVALAVPLSGVCLVLDDLDKPMLTDIAPAMGLNLTGDQGVMITDVIDRCFNPSQVSESANLLDIMFVRDGDAKVTMREKMVTQVTDMITSKFDAVRQKLTVSVPALADNAEVVKLRDILRLDGVDAMLLADRSALEQDALYQGMALDARGQDGVAVGFYTSAACPDHTVSAGLGAASGRSVPGVDGFVAKLRGFGAEAPGGGASCARAVICSPSLGVSDMAACSAGNNYVLLKQRVMGAGTFRCYYFETPGSPGTPCDPLSMTSDAHGAWSGDCLQPDGTMKTKEVPCTLPELVHHVRGFDLRIKKVMERLDGTVASVQGDIDVSLRALVNQAIVEPVTDMADRATCNFLGIYYQEMIDGFCYQGVRGMRRIANCYVACAILVVFFIILMYAVWRRSIDNVNSWDSTKVIEITKGAAAPACSHSSGLKQHQDQAKAGAATTPCEDLTEVIEIPKGAAAPACSNSNGLKQQQDQAEARAATTPSELEVISSP